MHEVHIYLYLWKEQARTETYITKQGINLSNNVPIN